MEASIREDDRQETFVMLDDCELSSVVEKLGVRALALHGITPTAKDNDVDSERTFVGGEKQEVAPFVLGEAVVIEREVIGAAAKGTLVVEGGEDGVEECRPTIVVDGIATAVVVWLDKEKRPVEGVPEVAFRLIVVVGLLFSFLVRFAFVRHPREFRLREALFCVFGCCDGAFGTFESGAKLKLFAAEFAKPFGELDKARI